MFRNNTCECHLRTKRKGKKRWKVTWRVTSLVAKVTKPPISFVRQGSRRNCFSYKLSNLYSQPSAWKQTFQSECKIKDECHWYCMTWSTGLLKLFWSIKQCYQFKISLINQHSAGSELHRKIFLAKALNSTKLWTLTHVLTLTVLWHLKLFTKSFMVLICGLLIWHCHCENHCLHSFSDFMCSLRGVVPKKSDHKAEFKNSRDRRSYIIMSIAACIDYRDKCVQEFWCENEKYYYE